MKRMSSSDSLAAVISIRPSSENNCSGGSKNNADVFDRGFKSILDGLEDEDSIEESGQIAEKKRRLTPGQVKALEKNFEVENKLQPDRKEKLAQEVGLQPRQVAVWFQNRRARWKTKQLEKEFCLLKTGYQSLKLNYDALHKDKEALSAQIGELKVKLKGENKADSNCLIKEEMVFSESENKVSEENKISGSSKGSENDTDHDRDHYSRGRPTLGDLKDRSSNSDCSIILNDENGPNGAISSEILPQQQHQQMVMVSPFESSLRYDTAYSMPPSINCIPFENSKILTNTQKAYHQFLKMEDHNHNFLNAEEEPCNLFSDEQALFPSWYSPDQWN